MTSKTTSSSAGRLGDVAGMGEGPLRDWCPQHFVGAQREIMPSSPHAVKYCDVCRVATHVSSRACNICGRQYSSQARSTKQAAWILGGFCVSVLSVPLLLAALAQSVRVNDQVNDKSVIVQHADSIAEG